MKHTIRRTAHIATGAVLPGIAACALAVLPALACGQAHAPATSRTAVTRPAPQRTTAPATIRPATAPPNMMRGATPSIPMQGDHSLTIRLSRHDGTPYKGGQYAMAMRTFAGYRNLAEGTVPETSTVEMKNLPGGPGTRPLTFMIDDAPVTQIDLSQGPEHRTLSLRLPPWKGDMAPDQSFRDIFTTGTVKLSDFRGKAVLLDFWATWCGPCQEPMQHNEEVLRRNADKWKDKAVILAASIDASTETARQRVEARGWTSMRHVWCDGPEPGWGATAVARYGIRSIPTALLIDQAGKIVHRGHPGSLEAEEAINRLLETP